MKRTSPLARSMAFHKAKGHYVSKTERYNPFSKRLNDLYGFIDMVVMDDQMGLLGVQVTTTKNMNARLAKIRSIPESTVWLNKGLRIQVEGWALQGPRGGRKTWHLTMGEITL